MVVSRGCWWHARWERWQRRWRHSMADKRQGKSLKVLTWVAAGGSEGERSKTKEVKKNTAREKIKRESWWLEEKRQIRKVCQEQRGLSPRLRVSRRTVGA